MPDSKIDENIVRLFVFENVLKYRNEYRLKILDAFFQRCLDGDKGKISEIYSEGKKYFYETNIYLELLKKYEMPIPEIEIKSSESPVTIPEKIVESVPDHPQNDFQALTKELEEIIDNVNDVLLIKHHAYKEDKFHELVAKLGILCNVKLNSALEKFSDEQLQDAINAGDIIMEISRIGRLNCLENENCKRLFSLLDQKISNSFTNEKTEFDE